MPLIDVGIDKLIDVWENLTDSGLCTSTGEEIVIHNWATLEAHFEPQISYTNLGLCSDTHDIIKYERTPENLTDSGLCTFRQSKLFTVRFEQVERQEITSHN